MTVENYQKVRVSPSGPTIASEGGYSSGRTWMWQGEASTTTVGVPNPTSSYASGLSNSQDMIVDMKPYDLSGLVYDIEVDTTVSITGTNTGLTIWVVGIPAGGSFAAPLVLATNTLALASAPAGVTLSESVRMHITNITFQSADIGTGPIVQVAVKLGFGSSPSTALAYVPDDTSLVIREYGTD